VALVELVELAAPAELAELVMVGLTLEAPISTGTLMSPEAGAPTMAPDMGVQLPGLPRVWRWAR